MLNPMTSVLIKTDVEEEKTAEEGKRPVEVEAESEALHSQAKRKLELPEAENSREGYFCRPSGVSMTLSTP